jgi:hypothetical protein
VVPLFRPMEALDKTVRDVELPRGSRRPCPFAGVQLSWERMCSQEAESDHRWGFRSSSDAHHILGNHPTSRPLYEAVPAEACH